MKKKGYRRKTTFKKKTESRLGLTGSLHQLVFWQTWTGLATRSTRQAGSGLITMLEPVSLKERKDIRCMAGFLGLELSPLGKNVACFRNNVLLNV